jgi:hypothetical protein
MGNILRKSSIFHKLGFNILARQLGAEPLIEMTAREFMFGYDDPLVGLGNKFLTSWIYFDKLGLIDRVSIKVIIFYIICMCFLSDIKLPHI